MTIREQEADGLAKAIGSNVRQNDGGEAHNVKQLPLAVLMVLATGSATVAAQTDAAPAPSRTGRNGN